jgi:hypothetical protein
MQSQRSATAAGAKSSSGKSNRPVSDGWVDAIGGRPSWRLVTAVIWACGCRSRILISSSAV